MTTSVSAVFEGGLLRPMTALELAEGTRVELIVLSDEKSAKDGQTARSILASIAALPTEGGDPRTSEDHDQILYGGQGSR